MHQFSIPTMIQGDTVYLLYAYHPLDPTGENDIQQHLFSQSVVINFFGSIVVPPAPDNLQYLDITNDNVSKECRLYDIHH